VVNRIFLPWFGCAGPRRIRGRCTTHQIQKLYPVLLGPGLVDGDTLKFLYRDFIYYNNHW
jgi:hypothetical protein